MSILHSADHVAWLQARAMLQGALFAACDAVHAITGRGDQSLLQIQELYPDHPAVKAWQKAKQAVADHDASEPEEKFNAS